MVSTVAFYLLWCRCLESIGGIKPQLSIATLMCLLAAARISNNYIVAVGQFAAPIKCVLSTCVTVRWKMKSWVVSGTGDRWQNELDTSLR